LCSESNWLNRIFNKINNLKIFSAGTKIALVRLKEK
jgi:hypothetical protein